MASRLEQTLEADEKTLRTITAAGRAGLPLELAAEVALVPPSLAAYWLQRGRRVRERARLQRLELNPATPDGIIAKFAGDWDGALSGLIAVLAGHLLEHARNDPKVADRLFRGAIREYGKRKRVRSQARGRSLARLATNAHALALDELAEAVPGGEDLADLIADLDPECGPVTPEDPGASGASISATLTRADGTGATLSLGLFEAESSGRTTVELEHYASTGRWPEHDPIETIGESMGAYVEPGATLEELGGMPSNEDLTRVPDIADPALATQPASAPKKRASARRIDPRADLIDLGKIETVVRVESEAVVELPDPDATVGRRINPLDR